MADGVPYLPVQGYKTCPRTVYSRPTPAIYKPDGPGDRSDQEIKASRLSKSSTVPCGEGFDAAIDDELMVCVHSHDRREILQVLESARPVRGGRFDLDCVQWSVTLPMPSRLAAKPVS